MIFIFRQLEIIIIYGQERLQMMHIFTIWNFKSLKWPQILIHLKHVHNFTEKHSQRCTCKFYIYYHNYLVCLLQFHKKLWNKLYFSFFDTHSQKWSTIFPLKSLFLNEKILFRSFLCIIYTTFQRPYEKLIQISSSNILDHSRVSFKTFSFSIKYLYF